MKKILYGMAICLLPMFTMAQVSHTVVFENNFVFEEVTVSDTETYTSIKHKSREYTQTPFMPILPVKYVRLLIPYNATVENVKTKYNSTERIPIKHPVILAPEDTTNAIDLVNNSSFQTNTTYPEVSVKVMEYNISRGNKIVSLAVYPFCYKADKLELEFTPEITINLKLKYNDSLKKEKHARKDKGYRKTLETMVDNKQDIDKYNVYKLNESVGSSKSNIAPVCDYIIVTSPSLASGFTNFINWKKQKGVNVAIVTTDAIFSNYTGDLISGIYDEAGKLRQFLKDCYYKGTQFVLLGGDYSHVPIRYMHLKSSCTCDPENLIPSDLYFSDFNGNWDANLKNSLIYL